MDHHPLCISHLQRNTSQRLTDPADLCRAFRCQSSQSSLTLTKYLLHSVVPTLLLLYIKFPGKQYHGARRLLLHLLQISSRLRIRHARNRAPIHLVLVSERTLGSDPAVAFTLRSLNLVVRHDVRLKNMHRVYRAYPKRRSRRWRSCCRMLLRLDSRRVVASISRPGAGSYMQRVRI